MLVGSNHNESQLFKTFARLSGSTFPQDAAMALDQKFTCGAAEAAKSRLMNGVPVWRYHFADNKIGTTDGAPHAGDIPYVFDVGIRYSGPLLSILGAANIPELVPVVQNAWGAFARDPQGGLSRYGWPKYDPEGKTIGRKLNL
jgi:cholinesterase